MNKNKSIGVIDGGIGGLTTVAEMQKLLPGEDIIFLGDSANNPFGNRPHEEIVHLIKVIVRYLEKQNVKAVAIACNTFSVFLDQYAKLFPFPFITVTDPVAPYVASLGITTVGVIATVATAESRAHEKLIKAVDPEIDVYAQGSPRLAKLIDSGEFNLFEIDNEIKINMDELLSKAEPGAIKHVILGCTHYPIVTDRFEYLYPGITFINPAYSQAMAVRELLVEHDAFNLQEKGKVILCTTGDTAVCEKVMARLSEQPADEIRHVVL